MSSNMIVPFDDSAFMSDDELLVNFIVIKPRHPLELQENRDTFRVSRSLLTSEDVSRTLIPIILSRVGVLPSFQHRSYVVESVSTGVASLPKDIHEIFVYLVVVNVKETNMTWCVHYMMTEELDDVDEAILLALMIVMEENEGRRSSPLIANKKLTDIWIVQSDI